MPGLENGVDEFVDSMNWILYNLLVVANDMTGVVLHSRERAWCELSIRVDGLRSDRRLANMSRYAAGAESRRAASQGCSAARDEP